MPDEETDVTFGDLDFDMIEAAVMETARGRWFLKEYAKRNRNADTGTILAALDGLKGETLGAQDMARLTQDLQDMSAAIRQVKTDIRSLPTADSGLTEAELQAEAEQRVRQMLRTFQALEAHVGKLLALCKAEPDPGAGAPGDGPFEGEKAHHLHPHPAFLM